MRWGFASPQKSLEPETCKQISIIKLIESLLSVILYNRNGTGGDNINCIKIINNVIYM